MNKLKKIFLASLFMTKPSLLAASSNIDLAMENTYSPTEILTLNAPEVSPQFVQRSADEFESIRARILQGPPASEVEKEKILSETVEFMHSHDIDFGLRYQLFYSFSEQGRSVLKERIFCFLENLIQNHSSENELILRNNIRTQLILLSGIDGNTDRIAQVFEKMMNSSNEWITKMIIFHIFSSVSQDLQEKIIDKILGELRSEIIAMDQFAAILYHLLKVSNEDKKALLIGEVWDILDSPDTPWVTKESFFLVFFSFPETFQSQVIDKVMEKISTQPSSIGEFASIFRYLLHTSSEEKKIWLINEILVTLNSSQIDGQIKHDFFSYFANFSPETQNPIIDGILNCLHNKSVSISRFSSIFYYFLHPNDEQKKIIMINKIFDIINSQNLAWHEKENFFYSFRSFDIDQQDQLIEKLFQFIDDGSLSPESLPNLLGMMLPQSNPDQKARLNSLVFPFIRSAELHFNIKAEFLSLVEYVPLDMQDQILDDVLRELDAQTISVENFFSIIPSLLNCKNEEKKEILFSKVVDFIKSPELSWDRKTKLIDRFSDPSQIKDQIIDILLEDLETKRLSMEQFIHLMMRLLNPIVTDENHIRINESTESPALIHKALELIDPKFPKM